MSTLKRGALIAMLLVGAATGTAVAQEPTQERVDFTISAPYQLRKSDVVFPAGKYILQQVAESGPDLFALYKDNLRHSPVALVKTTRIKYLNDNYPNKTEILLDTNDPPARGFPVVEGWTIPAMEGWKIIGVVASDSK
ncbi:MAG: hypothetical protein WBV94_16830 [Blastocatellia bacterium]